MAIMEVSHYQKSEIMAAMALSLKVDCKQKSKHDAELDSTNIKLVLANMKLDLSNTKLDLAHLNLDVTHIKLNLMHTKLDLPLIKFH